MTMHRFFVDTMAIKDKKVVFSAEISKQISKVLRLKVDDRVIVLDNTGNEYVVQLEELMPLAVGNIIFSKLNESEPKIKITLYQALTPKDKFESILQKCTEIGVSNFVPIETSRSLLKLTDLKAEKLDRWQKIIKEAAEQSERGRVPILEKALSFNEAIKQAADQDLVIIAWENSVNALVEVLEKTKIPKSLAIFIGPEGGFTQLEIELANRAGIKDFSLGSRVLRTETAGLIAASLVLYEFGDLDNPRSTS